MNLFKKVGLFLVTTVGLAGLFGCSPVTERQPDYMNDADRADAIVRVLYATDRNMTQDHSPAEIYGTRRGRLTYGRCDVAIPRDRRMGELETTTIWDLSFKFRSKGQVTVLSVTPQERDAFQSDLAARINVSSGKSLLLFVHGLDVSFEDAARRTAQMAYDLGFDGAPLFYSWPSRATPGAYLADETNAEWTLPDLRSLLVDIAESTPAENIYLIAHGMGSRALARAFISVIESNPELKKKFREIILTAPDIDADVFRRDIAPAITAAIPSAVTLYASSRDNAQKLSRGLHEYPRLGDTSSGVVILPGIDTIDATGVDSDFAGHSYFSENASVLADMFYLIREGKRPPQRFGLIPIDTPEGKYWKFGKTR